LRLPLVPPLLTVILWPCAVSLPHAVPNSRENFFADPVAMATKLGHNETDPYQATLLVLDAGARVEIVGAAPCYIHLSGVPGKNNHNTVKFSRCILNID